MTYVQLGAVKTWYDEHGDGRAAGAHARRAGGRAVVRAQPRRAGRATSTSTRPSARGHGHTPDVDGPITYQLMADDTIAFLETVVGEPADLVGHSDGAVVAMLVAMQRPELVKRLVMISGGFNKSGEAMPDMEWNVDQIVAVPRPRLRRGVPRRHRPLQGGGDQDRRDGRDGAEPAGLRPGHGAARARW